MLCATSAGKSWSIDSLLWGLWRKYVRKEKISWKECTGPQTCSRWNILILRWQVAIVFFFATTTKIQPDWLRGYPWKLYILGNYRVRPMVRWTLDFLLAFLSSDDAIRFYSLFISYGGIFYDGIIIPMFTYLTFRPIVFFFFYFWHPHSFFFLIFFLELGKKLSKFIYFCFYFCNFNFISYI